jgi:DNA-binding beta-propeller fold protein YncE
VSQLENSNRALAVSPDGRTVFVVATVQVGETANVVTNANDAATGALRWSASDPNSPFVSLNQASALAVNPDGKSVYVTINTRNRSLTPKRFHHDQLQCRHRCPALGQQRHRVRQSRLVCGRHP